MKPSDEVKQGWDGNGAPVADVPRKVESTRAEALRTQLIVNFSDPVPKEVQGLMVGSGDDVYPTAAAREETRVEAQRRLCPKGCDVHPHSKLCLRCGEGERLDEVLTQPAPRGGQEDVTAFILSEFDRIRKLHGGTLPSQYAELERRIKERRALGLEKYGTSLMTWNGRDPYADALEEVLDQVQYLTQARKERADLIAERDASARRYEALQKDLERAKEQLSREYVRQKDVIRELQVEKGKLKAQIGVLEAEAVERQKIVGGLTRTNCNISELLRGYGLRPSMTALGHVQQFRRLMEEKIAGLRKELDRVTIDRGAEIVDLQKALREVDLALGNCTALDACDTRGEKITLAMQQARLAEALEARLRRIAMDSDEGTVATLERVMRERREILDALKHFEDYGALGGAVGTVKKLIENRAAYDDAMRVHGERAREIAALQRERADLYQRNDAGARVNDALKVELESVRSELQSAVTKLQMVESPIPDVWFWQGDGMDHPESLTCPVVMSAETFTKLIASPKTDESLYACGRLEGHADVAAKLRAILDPEDKFHLTLDGALRAVGKLQRQAELPPAPDAITQIHRLVTEVGIAGAHGAVERVRALANAYKDARKDRDDAQMRVTELREELAYQKAQLSSAISTRDTAVDRASEMQERARAQAETLTAEVETLKDKLAKSEAELEEYRMRLAGAGTAAAGYFTRAQADDAQTLDYIRRCPTIASVISLYEQRRAAQDQLVQIINVASRHGWNGVENSKILATFLEDTLEGMRGEIGILRTERDEARASLEQALKVYDRDAGGTGLTIAEMVLSAHGNARAKGFYDGENGTVTRALISERLMLITSELAEALEHLRNGADPKAWWFDNGDSHPSVGKPDGFGIELADVVIRAGDLCGWLGIDLERMVVLKMAYNAKRKRMHGKEC